jgi:hypothetical protein
MVPKVSPIELAQLCSLTASSNAENNPYFGAVHMLAKLQELPQHAVSMAGAITFLRSLQRSCKGLLGQKDPVALLLLAMWYFTAQKSVWYIEQRAIVEGPAICLYLQRYHPSERAILELLPWRQSEARELREMNNLSI